MNNFINIVVGNTSPLEIAASLLGLVTVLISFLLWIRGILKRTNESRARDKARAHEEVCRMKEASSTVSSRSDIGYMVLIELSMHQNHLSFLRWMALVFFNISILIALMISTVVFLRKEVDILFIYGFVIFCFSFGISIYFVVISNRIRGLTDQFARDVFAIWDEPIEKKSARNWER